VKDQYVEVTRDEALALDHLIRSSKDRIRADSKGSDIGKALQDLLMSSSRKFSMLLNQDDD
jgi:hypothetical protein